MRRIIAIAFTLFSVAGLAAAQASSSGNVFFGYSYYNADLFSTERVSANGWEATVEGKVLPFIGIVADFDNHYSGTVHIPLSDCFGIGCPLQPSSGPIPSPGGYIIASVWGANFLFGPRVSVPLGRFRPFGEVLFGASHINAQVESATSFGTAVGGGIDYRLSRPLAWRFQGDYIHARAFGFGQNNVRVSTGIVLRF
jgi:opacity protein-like surface antigen